MMMLVIQLYQILECNSHISFNNLIGYMENTGINCPRDSQQINYSKWK